MTEITIAIRLEPKTDEYQVRVGDAADITHTRKTMAAMVAAVPAAALRIVLQQLVGKADEHPGEWVSVSSAEAK
jgi:hypothetical protein